MLLQFDLKMNPFQAGMIYVSTSIGFSLSPLLMPRLVNRHGPWFISLGAILYAASFVLLMIVVMHIPILRFPWLLLPALFALGPTQGMVMTPLLSIRIATVHGECAGMAAGGSLHFAAVGSRVRRDSASTIMQIALRKLLDLDALPQLQSAFVYSMLFNLAAVVIASLLLRTLPERPQRV
ncbi:hypothetical protein I6G56_26235 [Burkholderia humptydooensis]|uniref:Uncharacterized protein n=1 Tax=Burkholderia humptydooensis TaxID=430531 RepID=A0A7U4PB77_9BURK|nr:MULTISPECIES: MFS transporter [Burkholderia]AJY38653.1 hypothetical protein BW21_4877 [Burkholderia sp. 2002721687]ALX46353.1 hypothetical protein AQ610_28755 [Burkholderia humptydooensis]QPS47862.1 hypothetical protein I6G56_26235 [Burkholderia humptydooensis]